MTDQHSPIVAICPMCGRENAFAREELMASAAEAPWDDRPAALRGTCRGCGEPIGVRLPDAGGAAPAGRAGGRLEAVVAFAVLAALLLVFLVAVLRMNQP